MLTIRPEQIDTLNASAEEHFIDELTDYLCIQNIAVLPRFPSEQRRKIVQFMMARAHAWEATWKSSLCLYTDLMQTIAPNFDRHPAIREALHSSDYEDADERIMSLVERVAPSVWDEVESVRVDLYLYTAPDMDNATLIARTAAAMPIVLWDCVPQDSFYSEAQRSFELADRLGFVDLEDGPITAAVARGLYGSRLLDTNLYPWMADVLDPQRQNTECLELLRLRIALDFGRRV